MVNLKMKGDTKCESIALHEAVTTGSDAVVSQAISLVVTQSETREQLKTESEFLTHKSSNQSCSNSAEKPNCYSCKYRGELVYSAHSTCKHPLALIELVAHVKGVSLLGVKGNKHGINNGWFMYPFDFDPIWLEECNVYEPT